MHADTFHSICSILTSRDWPPVGLSKNTGTSRLGYLVRRRAWLAAGLSICVIYPFNWPWRSDKKWVTKVRNRKVTHTKVKWGSLQVWGSWTSRENWDNARKHGSCGKIDSSELRIGLAVSEDDKLDLQLLVGGEEQQTLVETLPEQPTT